MSLSRRALATASVAVGLLGPGVASAFASVTPGWECVPVTAGKAVVSGGTGAKPSCAAGTTAVLAPTYVPAGVGGKPTVEFSTINLQIVSGSGSTSGAVNGKGNLVVGYAEDPSNLARTGSNDLIVGTNNGWTGYGELVGGAQNRVSGPYATAFGNGNSASGAEASVTGGHFNVARDPWSSVAGGCDNLAGAGSVPSSLCSSYAEAILGGESNNATGAESTVTAGESNTASGSLATVSAGYGNSASGFVSSVSGGYGNGSKGTESSITGGGNNSTTGAISSIAGGYYNTATVDEASVLGGCSNVAGTGTVSLNPGCTSNGNSFTAIVGGIGNQDTPLGSVLLGGENNAIDSGQGGVIAGGRNVALAGATNDTTAIATQLFCPLGGSSC